MVTHTRTSLRTDRLRALNIPQPVQVKVDELGWPVTVGDQFCSATDDDGRGETTGNDERLPSYRPAVLPLSQPRRIEKVIETWRIDDEWWRIPISRRYVDVVLQGGGHVVLFEDLITRQWFVQMP